MKELWSPGAGVVKRLPPLHHKSARLSVSRPESGCPRDRNAGLRRLRNPASEIGGAEGIRTPEPKTASLVLSQLSYSPTRGITVQAGRTSCQEVRCGAGGGIRTRTPLRARPFEGRMPSSYITPASLFRPPLSSRMPHCTASRLSAVPSKEPAPLREVTEIVQPSSAFGRGTERLESNTSRRSAGSIWPSHSGASIVDERQACVSP